MDAANETSSESFEKCAKYWLRDDIAAVMQKHKSAAFEIAAGWNPDNFETWQAAYKTYLPLINDAYPYAYKVYVSAPACLDDLDSATAADYLSNTLTDITCSFSIHGSIDIDLGWLKIHIQWLYEKPSVIKFGIAVLKVSDIDNVKEITEYCKDNSVTIFPIDWYNDNSSISMTKDWFNYTDIGYSLSNILLSPIIIYSSGL